MGQRLKPELKCFLDSGTIIPAHPLALTASRKLDEEHQRLLTRYYMAAGAGGIAVGVHSTQFEIRAPQINLYERVLELAAEEVRQAKLNRPFLKIAGICGPTQQAVKEAETALKYGYDIGLLSMGGLHNYSEAEILDRTKAVASVIPIFGFYLQPNVGGRVFSYDFWLQFAEIENIVAIKVAAFNRYQTLDVVRAVCHSTRRNKIALYTGNDDNIVADLLTCYQFNIDGQMVQKEFIGGLLGHCAVWTNAVVNLFEQIKLCKANGRKGISDLLIKGIQVTDMNAAIFDPAHAYHGCIPGIHEVLKNQGLLKGTWCLNPEEKLSIGQADEIHRVIRDYPQLIDDEFVRDFINNEKNKKM